MFHEEFIELLKQTGSTTMKDKSGCEARPPFQGGKIRGWVLLVLGSRAPIRPEPLTQGYYISPLRGVTARFVSPNSTFPFPTIALIFPCPFDTDSDPDADKP
jgi:hypothetical protein